MKIRKGFVSNSSSSSFLIPFEKKPQSPEEVRKILFRPKIKTIESIYDYIVPKVYFTIEEISGVVYKEIAPQKPLSKKEIFDEIIDLADVYIDYGIAYERSNIFRERCEEKYGIRLYEGCKEFDEYINITKQEDDAIDAIWKKGAEAVYNKIGHLFDNKETYILKYGNEIGPDPQATLEYAFDTICKTKHIRINHHERKNNMKGKII